MGKQNAARVLVIGELNVDIVAVGLERLPVMGGEIITQDCELTLGSASAIFAVGMARLGSRVTFVSQVGKDTFGDFCLNALSREGISTTYVQRKTTEKTGVTISLSSMRDRALITYPGAIASFRVQEFDTSLITRHQHIHLTSYYLQRGLRPAFPGLFKKAKAEGLTTSFDPNSDPNSSWGDGIEEVLRHTDLLFVNEREATELTGFKKKRDALKALGRLVPCAVIKLGRKGAAAIHNDQVINHSGFKVNALDTTGAGDSFDAGFVAAYLRGAAMQDCLQQGNACGALSTLEAGGTAGQPTCRHLSEFLKERKVERQSIS
jgi:sugar/nucleoside kinase (ribokinase family)